MKLDGHQASQLAFIGRYPKSKEARSMTDRMPWRLPWCHVREIAESVIDPNRKEYREAADAIIKWAEPKESERAKHRKAYEDSINEIRRV